MSKIPGPLQYRRGTVIVALNTPHSVLVTVLDVQPNVENVRQSRIRDGIIYFSMYYGYTGNLPGSDVAGQIADLDTEFDTLPQLVNVFALQIAQAKDALPAPVVPMTAWEKIRAFFCTS